ncbi:MAG: efflux RND transporter periplasmic adaptor subunit [Beijerinckiaceae bacterium]
MASRKAAWFVAGALAVAGATAIAWPDLAEKVLPGAGEKAAAVRTNLGPLQAILPAYAPAAQTRVGQGEGAAGSGRQGAQSGGGQRGGGPGANRPPVLVVLDKAVRGEVPVVHDAVGTVQPLAVVALKSRVDAQVQEILVPDGAVVKAGEVLARLDSRQVEAQIKQAEASLARNKTVLEQANRDVARFEELVARNAGTKVNLDNAKTQVAAANASILGDEAQIENLKVQLGFYTIRAPISGRIGTVNVKAGNIIRAGDNNPTGTLATIVQTTPIYVVFSAPQRLLTDFRGALKDKTGYVEATPQGSQSPVRGRIAFIDNTIDPATGTVAVRAEFDNEDERLWPGQLCNLRIVLRTERDVVSVPRAATQSGQTGNFVYVVENGVARVRPVKVSRTQDGRDIISDGLKGGESIVVEGALALFNGARIETRTPAANAAVKRDS